jgi:hypothetical protein
VISDVIATDIDIVFSGSYLMAYWRVVERAVLMVALMVVLKVVLSAVRKVFLTASRLVDRTAESWAASMVSLLAAT